MLNKTLTAYRFRQFQFTPSLGMSLLACLFFAVMVQLGNWQRHRAHEKQFIIDQFEQNRKAEITPLSKLLQTSSEDTRYKPVKTSGNFLVKPIFLLDNQQQDGRIGYFVLHPFKPDNLNTIILVNRGFIPRTANRLEKLPFSLAISKLYQTIQGALVTTPAKTFTLGLNEEEQADKHIILQAVKVDELQKYFQYPLNKHLIQLDKSSLSFTEPAKPTQYLTPDRHYGYALQWYTMALVLFIIFIVTNTHKVRKS